MGGRPRGVSFQFPGDGPHGGGPGTPAPRRRPCRNETGAPAAGNLNKEPPDAEVHYLAHTIEEWRWYYEKIPSLALSFTANHAHLVPEGVAGFLDVLPLDRVAEVRLADCFRNGKEEHLLPGQGDFDFPALFQALEARGYQGHYMNAFGTLDDMLAARNRFAALA